MVGLPDPERRRGGAVQRQALLSPAGLSQAAALSPPAGMGLVGIASAPERLFSAVGSGWCFASLGQERQELSLGLSERVRMSSEGFHLTGGEGGSGEGGPGAAGSCQSQ